MTRRAFHRWSLRLSALAAAGSGLRTPTANVLILHDRLAHSCVLYVLPAFRGPVWARLADRKSVV